MISRKNILITLLGASVIAVSMPTQANIKNFDFSQFTAKDFSVGFGSGATNSVSSFISPRETINWLRQLDLTQVKDFCEKTISDSRASGLGYAIGAGLTTATIGYLTYKATQKTLKWLAKVYSQEKK